MTKLLLGCLSVALINAVSVRAEMRIDPSRVEAIAGFLPPHAAGLGQPATNRVFWNALAQRSELRSTIANASKLAQEETPALPDDLYLDFSKTGNRDRCQRVIFARNDRVTTFALAECLEDKGSFVQPLEREIEAVCRERTWVYPAHDGKLDNFRGRTVDIDLHAAYVAWNLATANRLLADKLSPATRQLIRTNIGRRVLQPFRDMIEGRRAENWWLRGKNNWSAVCHAGVAGAALALEDSSQTRAWHIAAAEKYMPFFLQSFTPDGYCSEGIGYWNYGFGNFLMLAETIRQATGNRIDLLDDPAAALPAQFGLRSETINGIYPSISDCVPGTKPDANLAGYAAKRFGRELPASPTARSAGNVDSLFSFLAFATSDEFAPANIMQGVVTDLPLRTWFSSGGVLICRPGPDPAVPFAVALKGGNNAENHNHNDVGSFSVVLGKTMLICDPGGEVYTARTFGPKRYDSKVLSSFGHAVPVVAGRLQRTGGEARAVVRKTEFKSDQDTLVLDIASAYAVPELQRLERTFVFKRSAPALLTVSDTVSFRQPKAFSTALITWSDWKTISPNELRIGDATNALRVRIETGGKPFKVSAEEINEDVRTPRKPTRIAVTLTQPVESATATLTITPEKPADTAEQK